MARFWPWLRFFTSSGENNALPTIYRETSFAVERRYVERCERKRTSSGPNSRFVYPGRTRQFWKVKRVPRESRTFRRVNNASARKIVTTLTRQTSFFLFFTKPAGHRRDFFSQVYPDSGDLFYSSKIIISIRENVLRGLSMSKISKVETPIVIDINESDGRRVLQSVRKPIAINFRDKLRRRCDVKFSPARIFDLSLCRTLETNPRRRSDDRKSWSTLETLFWRASPLIVARTREWKAERETFQEKSHYQQIQVQSAGCLELFDDYVQRIKVFRKI